jgi:uncharacterized RDD family membrane protein YckC
MLDTIHSIETPEGVDLDLRVAGAPARFLAWLIDLLLRAIAAVGLFIPFAAFGGFGVGMFGIIAFGLEFGYPVIFEVLSHGSTPGKKALRLQVVHRDGTPVGWMASILRNLLRFADLLPGTFGFGLLTMCATRSCQRLGDLAADTLVVYRDETRVQGKIPVVVPRPAPLPLRLAEQRAVIAFGQRAPLLPPARAAELAGLAEPLRRAEPIRVEDPVRHLYAIAAWLLGRREAG